MRKNNLYILVMLISLTGLLWTGFHYLHEVSITKQTYHTNVCLFKKTTGIPCPSCGTTGSVIYILKGQIKNAILANPLGFVMLLAMTGFPVWIAADWRLKKSSFFRFYQLVEKNFKIKTVAITSISFIAVLWIWNIIKHL